MHFITDSLLVGNLEDAQKPPPFIHGMLIVAEEREVKPAPGFIHERVPLKEFGEADPLDVQKAIEWLERQPPSHQLMVCCRAGMGRSVSMVIAYLCCVKGMSYVDAVQLLKARRPGATPLPGLERTIKKVQQLRQARASQSHGHPQADEAGRNRAEGPDSR
ncbi:MAG: hypothetical protein AUH21_00015 [Nitrospirae bacterium 13_2_20CM_62_7]|nr:MAG: hypothetical protein AUH21_00015 [Nitrospirae bacterium 13_2_20CM_62_7]